MHPFYQLTVSIGSESNYPPNLQCNFLLVKLATQYQKSQRNFGIWTAVMRVAYIRIYYVFHFQWMNTININQIVVSIHSFHNIFVVGVRLCAMQTDLVSKEILDKISGADSRVIPIPAHQLHDTYSHTFIVQHSNPNISFPVGNTLNANTVQTFYMYIVQWTYFSKTNATFLLYIMVNQYTYGYSMLFEYPITY